MLQIAIPGIEPRTQTYEICVLANYTISLIKRKEGESNPQGLLGSRVFKTRSVANLIALPITEKMGFEPISPFQEQHFSKVGKSPI